jgi:hypothetical protein
MKRPKRLPSQNKSKTLRSLCVALSAASAAMCADSSLNSPTPEPFKSDLSRTAVTRMPAFNVDEAHSPKTHTLFMGADIAINLDRDTYRVQDVMGSSWVVQIGGRDRVISAKEAPLNLKITPNLKLTETSVTITGFVRVQAYSYGNDPSVLLTKGLSKSSVMNADLRAVASNAQARQDTAQNAALAGANVFVGADDQFSANAQLITAAFAYSDTHASPNGFGDSPFAPSTNTNTTGAVVHAASIRGPSFLMSEAQNITIGHAQDAARADASQAANGDEATGKIVTGGLDAIDVMFDVRSAKILQNPYVVTMTKFRTAGSKPGMVQNMVYARSLHPIDEHISHVHFVQEGFPFGYELLDFQMHLYNRGVEVASNIASDRVELTRDEAFEYVKMEYMGAHLKDTLPAVPAMGKLPADFPSRLAAGKYRALIYVKVSKEGTANEAFTDASCTRRATDPYLDTVVQSLRFKPALNQGKTVEGIASLDLNRLTL